MKEKIELKTINDIFQLINEDNFDRFMLDFYKSFYNIAKAKGENPGKEWSESRMDSFDWIDDGENIITVDFNKDKQIKF